MRMKLEGIWHGDIMAEKSLLPYPYIFIYYQDYINIGVMMAKIKRVCEQCGKKYVGFGKRFCSQACVGKWKSLNFSGSESPRWRRIKRKCKICRKLFYVKRHELKRGTERGNFCSRECYYHFKSIDTKEKERLRDARKNIKLPTTPERIFLKIIKQNNLPFRYVGNRKLWIGKKSGTQLNPDFVEANGKKIYVEIFGDYWHSPLLNRKVKEYTTLNYRRSFFKRHKWQPFFIWESDLKRKDAEQFVLNTLKGVIE